MPFKKYDFLKNLTFLYSNKIYSFIISIIYTFVIANYLGPEKYGLVNLYINYMLSIFGLFGIVMIQTTLNRFTPRYKSKNLFKKTVRLQYIIIIPLTLTIIIFSGTIINLLKAQDITLLRLSVLILLIYPLNDSYIQLFQGLKRFGKTLKVNLLTNTLNLAISIALVIHLGYDVYGVIIAKIITSIISITMFSVYLRKIKFHNRKIDILQIKKYAHGAIPKSLSTGLTNQIILIYIGIFIGAKELGLYYFAQKITSWILTTPAISIREALLPYCIEESKDKRALERHASLSAKVSFLITIILSIILISASIIAIPTLFPEYTGSINLIALFSIAYIIGSYTCLQVIFISINKMTTLAKIDLIGLINVAIVGIILTPSMGSNGIIITQIISYIIIIALIYYSLVRDNFKISIIPTKNDIKYMIKLTKKIVNRQ